MNVLVVEDVPDVALTFAGLLRAYGNRTQVAYNGETALRIAGEWKPQMVFIDIGLPDIDGYQLAERLRQIQGLENACLVSVSGKDSDPDRAQEVGLNLHLKKPVSIDALLSLFSGEAKLNCAH